jgi:hypothetical protein
MPSLDNRLRNLEEHEELSHQVIAVVDVRELTAVEAEAALAEKRAELAACGDDGIILILDY